MLKIGLIGCGFMGAMHANCYKNIEGVEVTAFADIRKEKALELAKGSNAEIYSDGKDLIEKANVDVIDICLPTYLHAKYALLAMDKVKYLFVEKPVTLTMDEANEMLKKSVETGCNVQVGQVIRFWDEYVELQKIIESRKYGNVINANFRRLSPRPLWGWNNWLLDNDLSGGAAQDLHIHDTDFVLSLFGTPRKFYSLKNKTGEGNSYINTLMEYDGFVVSVEGTWDLPSTRPFEATFRVVFRKATIDNTGGKLMLYKDDDAEEIKIEKQQLAGKVEGGNISDLGGYFNELLYFTSMAKDNKKIDKATLEDAAESLKFVLGEIENA